jgi:hypothetical protein
LIHGKYKKIRKITNKPETAQAKAGRMNLGRIAPSERTSVGEGRAA